jgi:hypothetical protein
MDYTATGTSIQDTQVASGSGVEAAQNGFLFPTQPNLIDFRYYLYSSVAIPLPALPEDSPWPEYALIQAFSLVLPGCGIVYILAVYNCATHIVFLNTPDQAGQNYFAYARSPQGYGLVAPSTGLVASSSDEGTSSTLSSPDWAKGLTASQLICYKTPWGRQYLDWQQQYGSNIVGLS